MTIDELIYQLEDTGLPGDTLVYLAEDEGRHFTESDEIVITRVGTLDNPRTVVAVLY